MLRKNRNILTFLIVLSFTVSACKQSNLSLSDVVKSVCKIEVSYLNSHSFGTGFVVDGGYILTNAHVFNSNDTLRYITLKFRDEDVSKNAAIYKIDNDVDLALLKCDEDLDLSPINFSDKNVKIGDECFNIANQSNSDLNVSKGIISNPAISMRYLSVENQIFIEASIPIYPGSSGSPLLNNDYECIGVTTFRLKDQDSKPVTSYSYSIPSTKVKEFINL